MGLLIVLSGILIKKVYTSLMAPNSNAKTMISEFILDLSSMRMKTISESEISRFQERKAIDLSNNDLTYLPVAFFTLINLQQIDLSRNSIQELPESFGKLINLKHLDLYSNKLKDLPISFANLRNLKWLDLKNNPLNEELRNISGPSTTPNECARCAQNVLHFFQTKQKKIEIELQRATTEDDDFDEDVIFIEEKKSNKVIEEIVLTEDEEHDYISKKPFGRIQSIKRELFSDDEDYEIFEKAKDQDAYEEDGFIFLNPSEETHKTKKQCSTLKKEKSPNVQKKDQMQNNSFLKCRFWTLLVIGHFLLLFGFIMIFLYFDTNGRLLSNFDIQRSQVKQTMQNEMAYIENNAIYFFEIFLEAFIHIHSEVAKHWYHMIPDPVKKHIAEMLSSFVTHRQ